MHNPTITSAQYIQVDGVNNTIEATIDGEKVFVPIDTINTEYKLIKAKHDDADDSFTIADAS